MAAKCLLQTLEQVGQFATNSTKPNSENTRGVAASTNYHSDLVNRLKLLLQACHPPQFVKAAFRSESRRGSGLSNISTTQSVQDCGAVRLDVNNARFSRGATY